MQLQRHKDTDVLGTHVYATTPFGDRVIDVVLKHSQTGKIGGIELKSSSSEFYKFRADQFAKDRWINQFGADTYGQEATAGKVTRIDYTMKVLWE